MIVKDYSRKQSVFAATRALLLGLFICLVSCQKEDMADSNDGRFMILPTFYQAGMKISTRALISGYSEYTPAEGEAIYAWAQEHTSGTALLEGKFRRSNSKWYSSLEVEGNKYYRLFAFHPGGISTTGGTFTKSQSGDIFTLSVSPIDIITLGDPSISVAAARSYYVDCAYTDPTPVPGNFDLGKISTDLNHDKVLLAMNHLYSKVDMSFTLGETYGKLRSIVITDVKMVSAQGSSSMDLTFNANPTPSWGNYTDKELAVSLPLPDDSIKLSASNTVSLNNNVVEYTYHPAGSFCFLPKSGLPVALEVTYNVYTGDINTDPIDDSNYNKRIVRKNQTARNGKIMPSGTPQAGTSYPVKINVVPSYLYQLSDDDIEIKLIVE